MAGRLELQNPVLQELGRIAEEVAPKLKDKERLAKEGVSKLLQPWGPRKSVSHMETESGLL